MILFIISKQLVQYLSRYSKVKLVFCSARELFPNQSHFYYKKNLKMIFRNHLNVLQRLVTVTSLFFRQWKMLPVQFLERWFLLTGRTLRKPELLLCQMEKLSKIHFIDNYLPSSFFSFQTRLPGCTSFDFVVILINSKLLQLYQTLMEESLYIILRFGYQCRSLALQYFTLDLRFLEISFLTLR